MSRSLLLRALQRIGLLLLVAGLTRLAWGYVFLGPKWAPNSRITLALSLTSGSGLQDGSPSFSAVAQSAAGLWNQFLEGGMVLQTTTSGFPPASYADGHCNMLFAVNPYSGSYGDAIALCYIVDSGGSDIIEADILFAARLSWDSYRGPLQGSGSDPVYDFRRVAIHELGHLLGLDHPNQHGQSVSAIMNSRVSNIDVMQQDDINGIRALYGPGPTATPTRTPTPLPTPTPTRTPTPTPFPPGFQTPTPTASPTPTITPTPTKTPLPTPTLAPTPPPQALTGATLFVYRSPGFYGLADGVSATGNHFGAPEFSPSYRVGLFEGTGRQFELIGFRDSAQPNGNRRVPYVAIARSVVNQPLAAGSYNGLAGISPQGDNVALQFASLFSENFGADSAFHFPYYKYEAQIREVAYGPDGTLQKLALDFRYYDYVAGHTDAPESSVTGSLRYQSSLPVPGPRLVNLSTRLGVGSGDRVAIAGFVVQGDRPKSLIVRALGPTLGSFGVANPLARPKLRVLDAAGQLVRVGAHLPVAVGAARGMEPPNSLEPFCGLVLAPGAYTAIVESSDSTTGITLVEVYDTDVGTTARPVNLSTRGLVGQGESAMIAGFVVGGPTPKRLLIRATGPSLTQFGVTGVLADPVIELRSSTGTLLAQNDNWASQQQAEIAATPFAPANAAEPALLVALPAGAYTAIVRGVGDTTGVALVEVYELDTP